MVVPRAVFTDFPLGNTAGPPNEPDVQLAIARSSLEQANAAAEPGIINSLDHEWGQPWKAEARALKDHRTERFDSPQYQEANDRDAAIARHGQTAASGQ